jgi:hypothetical protein
MRDDGSEPGKSDGRPAVGSLVDLHTVRHRLVAYVARRVLMIDLRVHVPWLIQDRNGSIQLPTTVRMLEMMRSGEARLVEDATPDFTPTEKLRFQIDMLDAHGIRQGDKTIWQFLARAWTPDLVARFGPHDDPWRIRRWRAALRSGTKQHPSS